MVKGKFWGDNSLNSEIAELSVNLGGVILKKAEFENDFKKTYMKVFEKMVEIEFIENMEFDFLEILGELGG